MTKKLLALYGLKRNPFLADVPPEALFVSPGVDAFAFRLEKPRSRRRYVALSTEEPGTGKSVVCRLLAHRLQLLPELEDGVDLGRNLWSRLGPRSTVNSEIMLDSVNLSPITDGERSSPYATSGARTSPPLCFDPCYSSMKLSRCLARLCPKCDCSPRIEFDSRRILTVVLSDDARLLELFHEADLLPLASRIRVRLSRDYQSPDELANFLRSLMTHARHPELMTDPLTETLAEHAAGNYQRTPLDGYRAPRNCRSERTPENR